MIAPRHPQGPSSPDEDPTGVRALLSSLPDPGPMPPELVARITASIEHEQETRTRAAQGHGGDTASVSPLIRTPSSGEAPTAGARSGALGRPGRMRQLITIGGAAAAVVAVAAVGTVIALDQRPDVPSAAQVSSRPSPSEADGKAQQEAPGTTIPVHIETSGRNYTSSGFASQAKAMQVSNTAPAGKRPSGLSGAESNKVGTPVGLTACLDALDRTVRERPDGVWADLGTFDGKPAVIIVTTKDGKTTAWAVGRNCTAGKPSVLTGPTTIA